MRPQEYPLAWPYLWPRCKSPSPSPLKTSLPAAMENVRKELRLLGKDTGVSVKDVVISSNVTLGTSRPADPGIAVWFLWDGDWRCFPADLFRTPQENLQAIALIIEADRKKIRYGGIHFIRAAFKGHSNLALPGPSWRREFEFSDTEMVTLNEVDARYRRLVKIHHPDCGGDDGRFKRLTAAKAAAEKELKA